MLLRALCAVLLPCLIGWVSAVQAEPLSLTEAYSPVGITQATISPDGKHVAAIYSTGFGNRLVLVDTGDFSNRTILSSKWVQDGFYKVKKDPFHVTWISSRWTTRSRPKPSTWTASGWRTSALA